MVGHIYGRGSSLVSSKRPHMFAKEIEMYMDDFEKKVSSSPHTKKEIITMLEYKKNLEKGLDFCLEIAKKPPYPGENLKSISVCVKKQRSRLNRLNSRFEESIRLAS
jgi:hypothetical protein